jgi:hypothetical protein
MRGGWKKIKINKCVSTFIREMRVPSLIAEISKVPSSYSRRSRVLFRGAAKPPPKSGSKNE